MVSRVGYPTTSSNTSMLRQTIDALVWSLAVAGWLIGLGIWLCALVPELGQSVERWAAGWLL